jgi:hypothetical protein
MAFIWFLMTKVWTDQLQGLLLPDWRKRGKILLASKLGVEGQDNRKGRGGGAEQSATYEHMTPFCKSFGCLVDRWRMSQVDELPLLPASPANKTVISFIDNDAKLRGFSGLFRENQLHAHLRSWSCIFSSYYYY